MKRIIAFLRAIYGRELPADPAAWHRWTVYLPVRTADGRLTSGNVWRRRTATGWEYRNRPPTEDEWGAEQW